ncbi:MAG TPA: superoxide dismutase [Streptosporangiaceae bacterium]|jgi:sugar lactone lactonase YvrE
MKRLSIALVVLGLAMTAPAASAQERQADSHGKTAFPTSFPLPDGWRPEGIATGPGPVAYVGSLADGSIFRADLRTGRGTVFSKGPGTPSTGLKTDGHHRLFVSGGSGGNGRVVDTRTGAIVKSYQFTTATSFVNDVILTLGAAWFTDSTNPAIYKLPLRHGRLPDAAVSVPLSGDIVYGPGNNANGITATPDGKALLIVQSNTGLLFRVDPATGVTRQVDLGGESLLNGDGLLLRGRTLYAVQNRDNTVTVVRLDAHATMGRVVQRVTDPRFDVPSTVAAFGDRLYLPNARFTTTPTPTTPYSVNAIPRPKG